MTPAFVQANGAFSSAAAPVACAYTSNVTAGNLLIVAGGYADGNGFYADSISDSQGNSYTKVGPTLHSSYGIAVYYTTATASGANTVTFDPNTANGGFVRVLVHEYSGVDTLDQTASATATTVSLDSGPMVTTVPNELIFGWMVSNSGPSTAGTGFTTRETVASEITMDQIVSSTGTYHATATAPLDTWWVIGATFYQSSGGGITYTDSPSGTLDISGALTDARQAHDAPGGQITLAGSLIEQHFQGYADVSSGTLRLSGSVVESWSGPTAALLQAAGADFALYQTTVRDQHAYATAAGDQAVYPIMLSDTE